MSTLTITHSHAEGTIIHGTERGDGSAEVLKTQRWRWGRSIQAWFIPNSRDHLANTYRINRAAAALEDAGFDVAIEIDATVRTTAEVEEAKAERLAARAEALASKAARKEADAQVAWKRADQAYAVLPPGGEPIKVGHHSEGPHRNAIARAHQTMRTAVDAQGIAEETVRRAQVAAMSNDRRYNPVTVANRIKKQEAELRRIERALAWSDAAKALGDYAFAVLSDADQVRYKALVEELRDQIGYWKSVRDEQVASGRTSGYSSSSITKGDFIKYWGGWAEVVRVNEKTVTVKTQYSWSERVEYAKITGYRSK